MVEPLERAREAALETVRWTAGFDFPERTVECELVALSHPDEYAIERGRIVSDRGLDIDVAEYDEHFEELHVERSNALHSRLRERGTYLCGPLARYTLSSRPAVAARARGGRRGGPRARVPRPVPQHRRPQRRARVRLRRGAAADRRLRGARRAGRRRSSPSPAPGTARARRRAACSTTATGSTPRGRSSTRRSSRRPPRTSWRSRTTSATSSPQRPPRRRPAPRSLRADDPQLRPVHLLRDPLPRPRRCERR